jgi:hypothetical protein
MPGMQALQANQEARRRVVEIIAASALTARPGKPGAAISRGAAREIASLRSQ